MFNKHGISILQIVEGLGWVEDIEGSDFSQDKCHWNLSYLEGGGDGDDALHLESTVYIDLRSVAFNDIDNSSVIYLCC